MLNIIAIIPARGGSKGLPKKNIKNLNGKPLIHYTIEYARTYFKDSQICFTTDNLEIKDIAEQTGLKVPFLRPEYLATDKANTRDVILHAIKFYELKGENVDAVVLLQPTSPIRHKKHIVEAINSFNLDVDMVVSVKETSSNPYYVLFEEDEKGYLNKSKKGNFTRRQDCPKVWEFNGSIYVINVNSLKKEEISNFKKILPYEMSHYYSNDIDTIDDFEYVEYLLNNNNN